MKHLTLACGLALVLSGCEDGANFNFLSPRDKPAEDALPKQARSVKLIERDIEAPDVFQLTEAGLWDGRPSLGGVWVAHSNVKEPERVIIRNEANGKFVIGALFRRERENPGPRFQVSSDAAAAIGLLAGQPAKLNVTALRREEVPQEAPADATESLSAPAEIEAKPLDPIASASAAIDTAAKTPVAPAAQPTPSPAAKSTAKPASGLNKPYLQIGIFSVEANAKTAAKSMQKAGMVATVKKQSSKGKTFWRVLVGPATSVAERNSLLASIKKTGFTDAYAVTN
ncbi:SPOR domain-containing protein [Thalassovita taeanensis]|nr:SPOR domain-containing protein [Thalassovita taeanensis]